MTIGDIYSARISDDEFEAHSAFENFVENANKSLERKGKSGDYFFEDSLPALAVRSARDIAIKQFPCFDKLYTENTQWCLDIGPSKEGIESEIKSAISESGTLISAGQVHLAYIHEIKNLRENVIELTNYDKQGVPDSLNTLLEAYASRCEHDACTSFSSELGEIVTEIDVNPGNDSEGSTGHEVIFDTYLAHCLSQLIVNLNEDYNNDNFFFDLENKK